MELFIGFIMVLFLLGVPFAILQLVAQGMIFQGQVAIAAILVITMVLAIYYLTGVAYSARCVTG